ncbi:hypothetical protein CDD80_6042 [Ophiocordyceps camponoti-rufipedis]|uniref:Sodium/calcium exchanger membrane region domain-containing protein n=1 Tax=Ophiocordyceps camponoti-rufipedis TaxID=2004952 RepID=A0A2C5YNQ9_9HYPO|nr:hypothetical protein CDD80_6042 [Ophiocordyceps camponoti-rufipedis]
MLSHRSRPPSRPFVVAFLALALLTGYSFLNRGPPADLFFASHDGSHDGSHPPHLRRHHHDTDCRNIDAVTDKCAFVKRHCADVDAGLIPYLQLYYCTHQSARPLAFSLLVAWLGLLFSTIGIAASDFFCVNLATISAVLGLSQSLAGVTFLALGNGSPDVFSTFAAMSSNSPGMAIGELIGAASFIAGVVAGSMALVREFRVDRKTYARDICFFIVAVAFTMAFLADGNLHIWECCVMIGYYALYVITVVVSHWYDVKARRRLRRDTESRSHVYVMDGHVEELASEPYRDDDRSPLPVTPVSLEAGSLDEDDGDHGRLVAAEVTNNMRVVRSNHKRTPLTTPIRPSLVGALEFRAALAQLQRESNLHLSPLLVRGRSQSRPMLRRGTTCNALFVGSDDGIGVSTPVPSLARRDRALSSSDIPVASTVISPDLMDARLGRSRSRFLMPEAAQPERTNRSPTPSLPVIAVEPPSETDHEPSRESIPKLRLEIPGHSRSPSATSSPETAFPRYVDPSTLGDDDLQPPAPVPVRWWPYRVLPPPDVLLATLFPTLQGWREKSYWDRFLSAISVPSIFLLVITLPVVDMEATDEAAMERDVLSDGPSYGAMEGSAPAISVIPADGQAETGWDNYRLSPAADVSAEAPDGVASRDSVMSAKAPSEIRSASKGSKEPPSWNRWLVCVQLFSGPLFSTLILWANMREDMGRPGRELVRMMAFSLLLSALLLAVVLMTTTGQRRPRLHYLLCFLGFVISVAWISTIAGEVVGVLKAFGVMLGISEALLGLTVFAAGNSIGDLVADITVARLGYPVMALSACFGGPMLNILLGIGIGGVMMMIKQANKEHGQHPGEPMRYGPYRMQLGATLFVSGVTLLLMLVALVVLVPMNKWILSRRIGWLVIMMWVVSTAVSVVVELTGKSSGLASAE